MSDINTKQKTIVAEFEAIESWEDRYKKIIAIGKEHEAIPKEYMIEDNKVKGCQSQVWMFAEISELGKMKVYADSDAMIVRGLVALLVRLYSEESVKDIMATEPSFISEIGLSDHLSQSRANGLVAMIKQIKMYAMAYSLKI